LSNGVHLWNKSVIEKRRFELIVIPDPPKGEESAEIQNIRDEVSQIQKQKPWLFRKNDLFSVVKEWVDEGAVQEATVPSRRLEIKDVSFSRKRTIDEVITAEEDPFLLATPIKQGRKSIFADTPAAKAFKEFENAKLSPNENDVTMSPVINKDINNQAMTDKQWERIKQITKTPPATPLVSHIMISPQPSAARPPTSILKSNKKQSRITPSTKRVKLQFDDNISQVKSIPNRHEQKTPVPDAFTMEDSSIISEIEHPEVEDDDNDSPNEADLSYGPVKLNFDAIDGNEENDIIVDSSEIQVENVLIRSFEAQDEDDCKSDEEKLSESEKQFPKDDRLENKEMENVIVLNEPIDDVENNEIQDDVPLKPDCEAMAEDKDVLIRSFEAQDEDDFKNDECAANKTEVTTSTSNSRNDKSNVNETEVIYADNSLNNVTAASNYAEEWRQKHRRPVPSKRLTRRTPSRESSSEPVESLSIRRSTRIRKSSVAEESQPAKIMEPISEVSKLPTPSQSQRLVRSARKTPSRESSVEHENLTPRKSKRIRKSSSNDGSEEQMIQSRPGLILFYWDLS
jgi:hypothetical protein